MPERKHSQQKQSPPWLILAGIALLVLAVMVLKNDQQAPVSTVSLEEQYNQALEEKQPTFVFLHSLDCIPCKAMMDVVAQVVPEFQGQVVLSMWMYTTNAIRTSYAEKVCR